MLPAHHPAPFAVGLIGVTGYGAIYRDLLRDASPRVRLAAATVLPSQLGLDVVEDLRRDGVEIHVDHSAMLAAHAGRLDLVMVPTPIHWHARMTREALASGANVLVEKPLAGSRRDADAVVAAEAATGRWVAVGFQDCYTEEVHWLKRRLLEGAIGDLRRVSAVGLWPRGRRYYGRNAWAGRLAVDGVPVLDSPLNNAFAHFVNLALFLGGATAGDSADVEVTGSELLRAHAIDTFDTALVHAVDRARPGLRYWFGFSHACAADSRPEVLVEGTRGIARWTLEGQATVLPREGIAEARTVPDYAATRRAMFESVLARLEDGRSPVFGTRQAGRHVALVEDLHRRGIVRDVDPSLVDWRSDANGDEVPVIRGLDDALPRAWRAGTTLAEQGVGSPAVTSPA